MSSVTGVGHLSSDHCAGWLSGRSVDNRGRRATGNCQQGYLLLAVCYYCPHLDMLELTHSMLCYSDKL